MIIIKIVAAVIMASCVLYTAAYMCIYTAAINYEILDRMGFDPEIRGKYMIGTPYLHIYVHVRGVDLFLNPFRSYSRQHKTYGNVTELKNRMYNWGMLYNPVSDSFVRCSNEIR